MIPVTNGYAVPSPCYGKTVLVPGLLTAGSLGEFASGLVRKAEVKVKVKSKSKVTLA